MLFPSSLRVQDSSHPGEARRLVSALGRVLGFDETRIAQAALVVTELATNLLKHTAGAGGELILSPINEELASGVSGASAARGVSGARGARGVSSVTGARGPSGANCEWGRFGLDILALDHGPGITKLGDCLRDGYSSAGSMGTGLGAIRRQSSVFDIYSVPGQGTAVFSRIWKSTPPDLLPTFAVAAVCLPLIGEQTCGDAWAMKSEHEAVRFMLADGLGHGPNAAAASGLAVDIFHKNALRPVEELLGLIHAGLRGTRGAAVAVAEVALIERVVRFAGVGNLCGLIVSGGRSRNMASHNGTAGVEARKIKAFTYPWPDDATLVLHSDGLGTHWSLEKYPGLVNKHPAIVAGVLFRDHQRPRDDSTVVVAKAKEGRGVA